MKLKNPTALLVMDVQAGIVNGLGDNASSYINRVSAAVEASHKAGIPVFFIVVRFREGYPELNRRNKMFDRIFSDPQYSLTDTSPDTQPVITPGPDDIVVSKKRVSAFAGSDLGMLLQARDITELVLCGIATSGVVLSTLRQAADWDYSITVLSDCCADRDEEVHRILMEKIFPRQASVITHTEWMKSISAG